MTNSAIKIMHNNANANCMMRMLEHPYKKMLRIKLRWLPDIAEMVGNKTEVASCNFSRYLVKLVLEPQYSIIDNLRIR